MWRGGPAWWCVADHTKRRDRALQLDLPAQPLQPEEEVAGDAREEDEEELEPHLLLVVEIRCGRWSARARARRRFGRRFDGAVCFRTLGCVGRRSFCTRRPLVDSVYHSILQKKLVECHDAALPGFKPIWDAIADTVEDSHGIQSDEERLHNT